jgi:hypothetical protein
MDDIGDRQKIGFVLQFGDQGELMLDLGSHRIRKTLGITSPGSFIGKVTQPARGAVALRHDLIRIFITQ